LNVGVGQLRVVMAMSESILTPPALWTLGMTLEVVAMARGLDAPLPNT